MLYKNISSATKTFYGVQFKPGEIKSVPGYINAPKFIKIEGDIKEHIKEVPKKQITKKSEPSTPIIPEITTQEEISDGSDNNQ